MTKINLFKSNWRPILIWPLLGLLLCAALWTATLLQLRAEKSLVQKHALENVASLSKAYGQYLARTLEQVDQITMQLKYEWEYSRGALKLEKLRENGLYAAPQFALVAILDKTGKPLTATLPLERLRSSDEAADLHQHALSKSGALRVGVGPAAGQSGRAALHFTRRLEAPNGDFAGVVVLSLDPAYFAEFYDNVKFGQYGFLAMAGENGALYSTRVGDSVRALTRAPFFDAHPLSADSGAISSRQRLSFEDGMARFVGWQTLKSHEFAAVVGLSEAEVFAPYRETRALYLLIANLASALLLLFAAVGCGLSVRLAVRKQRADGVHSAYRMATEGTSDGFYIVAAIRDDKGEICDFEFVDCNRPGAAYFGLTRERLLGQRLRARGDDPYFRELMGYYLEAMASGFSEHELRLQADNPLGLEWIRRRLVRSGERLAVTVQDISRAKQHEAQMQRLANEDGLTGLPNRHWLASYLPGALDQARQRQSVMALLFIDLDGFKDINDTRGHAEGDKILQSAAARLRGVLRPGDHVARLGGDEFIVLLDPVEDEAKVRRVAERIAEAFEAPFTLGDGKHKMGASIGISLFPRDGGDTQVLLKHADIAMYAVKNAGKGHFRFYQPELYEAIRRRREIEQSLTVALEQDQFVVAYQPRACAVSGALLSMEALVRWQHPRNGMVPPLEFIPVAESCGLIARLGELVIDKVCAQIASWKAQGLALAPDSINVSAHQFSRGDLHVVLAASLARHQVDARLIEVEITESAMMGDQAHALKQLAAIRAQGIKLLVDDFGTGYSSLSQLQRFEMDGLKIDRAFTSELGQSAKGEIFVRAILSMAHALGMTVVAEGVETLAQLDVLRALNCNEVQGYYISRPVPPEQMAALMRKALLLPAPPALAAVG